MSVKALGCSRMKKRPGWNMSGFTLIEVLVALVIMGLVLGGLYTAIQAQIDLRYKLQQRYVGQTASWNRLLQQYQIIQEWVPRGDTLGDKSGQSEVLGGDFYWELSVQETLGEDFYRYEVQAYSDPDAPSAGSLVVYFVAN